MKEIINDLVEVIWIGGPDDGDINLQLRHNPKEWIGVALGGFTIWDDNNAD